MGLGYIRLYNIHLTYRMGAETNHSSQLKQISQFLYGLKTLKTHDLTHTEKYKEIAV